MPLIPPTGTKGRYTVKAPFQTTPGILYTCGAVRYFVDIENKGSNVYEEYYANAPSPIAESVYRTDRQNGEVIITLLSDTEAPIYIPSSYITAYPSLDSVPYHHVVASASISALPVSVSLDFLESQIKKIISDTIGVEPVINWGVVPLTDVMSPTQHEAAEAAREAAILNRTTDYARLAVVQAQLALSQERLAIAEKIIKDKNLIP